MNPLDEIETSEDQATLIGYTRSEDAEVRFRAVEKLSCLPCTQDILDVLRERLSDPDELVRIACLEGLEDYDDAASIPLIRACTADGEWLVRGNAAIALVRLGAPDAREIVRTLLETCTDEEERVRYLAANFFLCADALDALKRAFETDHYRVRCAIAHLIADAVSARWIRNDAVLSDARAFLAQRLTENHPVSVKSSLAGALSDIDAAVAELRDA